MSDTSIPRGNVLPRPGAEFGRSHGLRTDRQTTLCCTWDWDCPGSVDTLKLLSEVFLIPRSRPPHSPEFRRQMVDLVRAGRNPDDLAREFEPTGQSIRAWVGVADRQEGRREDVPPVMAAAERDELARLRREVRQLRLERDILSKAAAWFARETGTIPSGSSGS